MHVWALMDAADATTDPSAAIDPFWSHSEHTLAVSGIAVGLGASSAIFVTCSLDSQFAVCSLGFREVLRCDRARLGSLSPAATLSGTHVCIMGRAPWCTSAVCSHRRSSISPVSATATSGPAIRHGTCPSVFLCRKGQLPAGATCVALDPFEHAVYFGSVDGAVYQADLIGGDASDAKVSCCASAPALSWRT